MKTDIEIAQEAQMLPITEVVKEIGLIGEMTWSCTESTKQRSRMNI